MSLDSKWLITVGGPSPNRDGLMIPGEREEVPQHFSGMADQPRDLTGAVTTREVTLTVRLVAAVKSVADASWLHVTEYCQDV